MTIAPVSAAPIRRNASRLPSLSSAVAVLRSARGSLLVLAVGIALVFGYLVLVNSTATIGLTTSKVQHELRTLQSETKQLEVQLANLQSFATLERTGQALELTARATPDFVPAEPTGVAVR